MLSLSNATSCLAVTEVRTPAWCLSFTHNSSSQCLVSTGVSEHLLISRLVTARVVSHYSPSIAVGPGSR